jgi:hypothetical protein
MQRTFAAAEILLMSNPEKLGVQCSSPGDILKPTDRVSSGDFAFGIRPNVEGFELFLQGVQTPSQRNSRGLPGFLSTLPTASQRSLRRMKETKR